MINLTWHDYCVSVFQWNIPYISWLSRPKWPQLLFQSMVAHSCHNDSTRNCIVSACLPDLSLNFYESTDWSWANQSIYIQAQSTQSVLSYNWADHLTSHNAMYWTAIFHLSFNCALYIYRHHFVIFLYHSRKSSNQSAIRHNSTSSSLSKNDQNPTTIKKVVL